MLCYRRGSLVSALLLFLLLSAAAISARGAELAVAGQAAVLMEMKSGKILWAKNRDLPLSPASTVKIMTALVVLEHSRLDAIVTVPIAATLAKGATANLQGGERLTVRDLLYALMLQSGNDAAIALASYVSGSPAKFAQLMTQKARALGALQSHFANPAGLARRDQSTTARDLAVIARAAMQNPDFRKIVATQEYSWKSAKWQGVIKNSNPLLQDYDGAIGVKTGNTGEAGDSFVAAARRGGDAFIAVVLKSTVPAIWQDAKILLDYGFSNFSPAVLVERGETVVTSVVDGNKVPLAAAEAARHIFRSQDADPPEMHIKLDELETPIAKGEKLGEAVFRDGDKEIARIDLISKVAVPDRLPVIWIFTGFGVLAFGLFVLRFRAQRRRNRYIFAGRGNRWRLR